MKSLLLLLVLGVASALAAAARPPQIDLRDAKMLFNQFMITYNKVYENSDVVAYRYQVFKDNLNTINAMNNRSTSKATFGITKFTDLTAAEFQHKYLTYKKNVHAPRPYIHLPISKLNIPSSFDWRTHGAVTPVYDQGQCGSCWAFSATEAIESQWFLAGNTLPELAPQQIVDCDTGRGDEGCEGGDTTTAYEYVIAAKGMESEADYPYTAEDGTCAFNSKDIVATISNWTYITQNLNETEMMYKLVEYGPLSICVDAESWQFYFGGVLSELCPSAEDDLDHCVMITGFEDYTTWDDETVPIWLIRNSWGADWGEDGYIYVERGYNLCGVADEVTIPLVH